MHPTGPRSSLAWLRRGEIAYLKMIKEKTMVFGNHELRGLLCNQNFIFWRPLLAREPDSGPTYFCTPFCMQWWSMIKTLGDLLPLKFFWQKTKLFIHGNIFLDRTVRGASSLTSESCQRPGKENGVKWVWLFSPCGHTKDLQAELVFNYFPGQSNQAGLVGRNCQVTSIPPVSLNLTTSL